MNNIYFIYIYILLILHYKIGEDPTDPSDPTATTEYIFT